ncbi:MAG: hypothetical protein ACHQC8_03490 [Solirubrobacterales bacterium]
MSAINVGDRWKRREPMGDAYDEITVCGLVDHAGRRPSEYSIASATSFGPVLQTDAAGIIDFCDLVASGDPDDEWESEL